MSKSNSPMRSGISKIPSHAGNGFFERKPSRAHFRKGGSQVARARSLALAVPGPAVAASIDQGLAAMGIAVAIGSAAFAAYMINQASGTTKVERVKFPVVLTHAPVVRPHVSQQRPTSMQRLPVDTAVASSSSRIESRVDVQSTVASGNISPAPHQTDLKSNSYAVRFVHRGMAIVQSADGLYVTRRGTKLPDAGQVISIERLGNKWILMTDRITITETHGDL
jgi:hypothetical protein